MKATLSKIAAIFSIVIGALGIIGGILVASLSWIIAQAVEWIPGYWDYSSGYYIGGYYNYYMNYGIMITCIVMGIILVALSITQVVLGAKLLKKLDKPNGLLIATIVISFLGGSLITTILAVIALCLRGSTANSSQKNKEIPETATGEFKKTVERLKLYLSDGIITETVYKQKLEEASKKYTNLLIENVK